jgi:hypothetical protein
MFELIIVFIIARFSAASCIRIESGVEDMSVCTVLLG